MFDIFLWGIPLIGAMSGMAYFVLSRSDAPLWKRLITSSYGPVIALALVALFFLPPGYPYRDFVPVFWWLLLIPLVLMFYSLVSYPGRRLVHILIPFNVIGLGWLLLAGTLAIGGK